jgi:hypothetical protein
MEILAEDPAVRFSTATLLAVCFAVGAGSWYVNAWVRKSRPPRFIGEMILAVALALWGIAIARYSTLHGGSLRPLDNGISCLIASIGVQILAYRRHKRKERQR